MTRASLFLGMVSGSCVVARVLTAQEALLPAAEISGKKAGRKKMAGIVVQVIGSPQNTTYNKCDPRRFAKGNDER